MGKLAYILSIFAIILGTVNSMTDVSRSIKINQLEDEVRQLQSALNRYRN